MDDRYELTIAEREEDLWADEVPRCEACGRMLDDDEMLHNGALCNRCAPTCKPRQIGEPHARHARSTGPPAGEARQEPGELPRAAARGRCVEAPHGERCGHG